MTNQPPAQPTPDPDNWDATLMDGLHNDQLDPADLHVRSLIYQAVYRAHGYTRMPGSVVYDENGEVA